MPKRNGRWESTTSSAGRDFCRFIISLRLGHAADFLHHRRMFVLTPFHQNSSHLVRCQTPLDALIRHWPLSLFPLR